MSEAISAHQGANEEDIVDILENSTDPFIFLTGKAGAGKTASLRRFTKSTRKDVLTCAPTGVAAVNCGGMTIHRLFRLPIKPLDDKDIAEIAQRQSKAVKLADVLIIDEISMVSSPLLDAMDKILRKCRRRADKPFGGIQVVATGDMCFASGTKIVMHDGSLKKIEDIVIGDSVMGPDSSPRLVKRLFSGEAEMFDIHQANAATYRVTANHPVVMKRSATGRSSSEGYRRYPEHGDEIQISAKELSTKSEKFLSCFSGFKSGQIEIPESPTPLEPYLLGLWLGDGESTSGRISNPDEEVIQYCREVSTRMGLVFSSRKERLDTECLRISITNPSGTRSADRAEAFSSILKRIGVFGNKHVPQCFISNSARVRLELLAGLIDSDGSFGGNRFTFSNMNHRLALDAKFIADSLGFRTSISTVNTKNGNAYCVQIGGDIWRIPTKIARKKACEHSLGRNRLISKLRSISVGIGDYFGIEVGGDRLFLLEDFTVVHNCQLAPVTREEEWKLHKDKYETQYFFSAPCFKTHPMKILNMVKTFRQSESEKDFLEILNGVRNGRLSQDLLDKLNSRHRPNFTVQPGYVSLCPTNNMVDSVNSKELDKIPEAPVAYRAEVTGEFKPKDCLADELLTLKPGAQVMCLRNDVSGRYVNGTIAVVDRCDRDQIIININGEKVAIEQDLWESMQYETSQKDGVDVISQTVTGSMSQYPIKLAFAVSIHKSQGKTYDKCIVDPRGIFENGQLYVALSRCTTLSGLILKNKVLQNDIRVDERVVKWVAAMRQSGNWVDVHQKFIQQSSAPVIEKIATSAESLIDRVSKGDFPTDSEIIEIAAMRPEELQEFGSKCVSVLLDEIQMRRLEIEKLKRDNASLKGKITTASKKESLSGSVKSAEAKKKNKDTQKLLDAWKRYYEL